MNRLARKLAQRTRLLGELVGTTVKKDIDRRTRDKADAHLAEHTSSEHDTEGTAQVARFDAHAPHVMRTLPAANEPHTTEFEYAESMVERVATALREKKIPHVVIPGFDGSPGTIGVLEGDWKNAIAALNVEVQSDGHTLIAGDPDPAGTTDASLLTFNRETNPALQQANRVVLFRPAATFDGKRATSRYGFDTAVSINRWVINERGIAEATVWNRRTGQLHPDAFQGVEEHLEPLRTPHLAEVMFPIDAVYTWVDGTDPEWAARKRAAVERFTGEELTEDAAADLRFVDHDELRYSLRSLEQYAPWIRHIYIVTDRQRPEWLREDHPRITVIDHSEIFPDEDMLPTFNSHAIEACLHRIPGLSEHFLYLNDDVFLSSRVSPDLFVSASGISSMFNSRAQVGVGEPFAGEIASDTAGKKARAIIQEAVGRRLSQKLFHAPFLLNRAVSEEIESRWSDLVDFTRRSTFRRTEDITLSGSLHINYAFATGRAAHHGIRYRYVNIGALNAKDELDRLFRDRHALQTFCLNESDPELPAGEIDSLVRAFLKKRFPDKSTFEK